MTEPRTNRAAQACARLLLSLVLVCGLAASGSAQEDGQETSGPKPAPKQQAKPAPKPQAKPAPKPQTKPAPKPQAKPAPKPQAKPAPKPQTKPPTHPAPKPQTKPAPKPQAKPAAQPQAKPAAQVGSKPTPPASTLVPKAPACQLVTAELPRGGRLEVTVDDTGKAPVVRVDGKVARMIQRTETTVAAQVPPQSNGGPVTLQRGKKRLACGSLTIIGVD